MFDAIGIGSNYNCLRDAMLFTQAKRRRTIFTAAMFGLLVLIFAGEAFGADENDTEPGYVKWRHFQKDHASYEVLIDEKLAGNRPGLADIRHALDERIDRDINPEHGGEHSYSAQIEMLTDRLASLSITVAENYQGAMHGSAYMLSLNYDRQDRHPLQLSDLFLSDSNYLRFLSLESRRQLTESMPDIYVSPDQLNKDSLKAWQDMRDSGTEPKERNFAAFNITGKGLLISFSNYQVAPYMAGLPTVVIPLKQLKPYLKPTATVFWSNQSAQK